MTKINTDLKQYAKKKGVHLWQVADALGISEATIIRKMRHELSDVEQARFIAAVDACAERG